MHLTTFRQSAVAGCIALAAWGLAACSPPHQVDSAHKVDTAVSQDPGSLAVGEVAAAETERTNVAEASEANQALSEESEQSPVYRNCDEPGVQQPQRLTLSCEDQDDFVENIIWDKWNDNIASGKGTRVTVDPDRREDDVQIVLGNAQEVNGLVEFTNVTVQGIQINPESRY